MAFRRTTKLIKKTMKSQKNLVFLYVFVALSMLSFVSAADLANVATLTTKFNGVTLGSGVDLVIDSEAEVEVIFDAAKNASDVKVKVEVMGESDNAYFGDIIAGKTYRKVLSLDSLSGIDDLTKEYSLYVSVFNNVDKTELKYTVTLQRESYQMSVLSADFSSQVEAGKVFPISVVLKNVGYNKMDDVYVEVSLPELGVTTRSYVGDIVPLDDDEDDDAKESVVYLEVPETAKAGVYTLSVKAYDRDGETQTLVNKLISISEATSTKVLTTMNNQDLIAGKATTYDIVVVNNGNSVKTLPLTTMSSSSLKVIAPQLVTVSPYSSQVVSIEVEQANEAEEGTYTFTAIVDGKQLVFTANVIGRATSTMSGSIVALLAVLAIIFVVLLVVLVVLISKKDKAVEEVETSYY